MRQVEARQAAAKADLLAIDERIGLQRNAIAALLGPVPTAAWPSPVRAAQVADLKGLPPNLALDLLGRRPDIVAARSRTEAAAHRIDQSKAGFYPSVNLLAFAGLQSLGIENLSKSGSQVGCGRSGDLAAHLQHATACRAQLRGARAEYDAAVATYNATLSKALREVADAATSRKVAR